MDHPDEEDALEQLRKMTDAEERARTAREYDLVRELGSALACEGNGPEAQLNWTFFDPCPTPPKRRKTRSKSTNSPAKGAQQQAQSAQQLPKTCPHCGGRLA